MLSERLLRPFHSWWLSFRLVMTGTQCTLPPPPPSHPVAITLLTHTLGAKVSTAPLPCPPNTGIQPLPQHQGTEEMCSLPRGLPCCKPPRPPRAWLPDSFWLFLLSVAVGALESLTATPPPDWPLQPARTPGQAAAACSLHAETGFRLLVPCPYPRGCICSEVSSV